MAGILSPSMPVVVVENAAAGNRAFATLNEGLGKVLRFGAYGAEVLDRLRWMAATLGPALDAALRRCAARSTCGASSPRRSRWATSATTATSRRPRCFARLLAPALVRARRRPTIAAAVLDFLGRQRPLLPEPLDGGVQVRRSTPRTASPAATVVTAMARNGVEFGIRVSGTGDALVHRRRPHVPDGLYFPGYGPADANPDLGDSAITETTGPRRLRDGGGARPSCGSSAARAEDALAYTREMSDDHAGARTPTTRMPRARLRGDADRHRLAGASSTAACCPSSTPASRTASRGSVRSVRASLGRRCRALPPHWRSWGAASVSTGARRLERQEAQKGPDARRRPKAAREA